MARPKSENALSAAERKRLWRLRQAGTETPAGNENPGTETCAGTETHDAGATADSRPAEFVRFRHQPHVPFKLFYGHGRGTVRVHTDGKQYVMVSRHEGSDLGELGVVTATDWQARLGQRCEHGNSGWACHTC